MRRGDSVASRATVVQPRLFSSWAIMMMLRGVAVRVQEMTSVVVVELEFVFIKLVLVHTLAMLAVPYPWQK
jgi:hypothetical protein